MRSRYVRVSHAKVRMVLSKHAEAAPLHLYQHALFGDCYTLVHAHQWLSRFVCRNILGARPTPNCLCVPRCCTSSLQRFDASLSSRLMFDGGIYLHQDPTPRSHHVNGNGYAGALLIMHHKLADVE